jgi:hypothetical protein
MKNFLFIVNTVVISSKEHTIVYPNFFSVLRIIGYYIIILIVV